MDISTAGFWISVAEIIAIDVVLSGDNAVVIALACRDLPPLKRRAGIFWGVTGAIGLRVVLTAFAATLFDLPWVKLGGGLLLLWIGVKLMLPEKDDDDPEVKAAEHLWAAIRIIVLADFVMSLDNVVGIAAAARGNLLLLLFGLAFSIPLIVWASQMIMTLMERFPIVITLGAGLLGYVAGDMITDDPLLREAMHSLPAIVPQLSGALGAVVVVILGRWLARRAAVPARRPS
jgi:YjbE family integral membrane protein